MTKVPVLVTGGAGYIGSHAVLALRDAGWPVAVIDNLTTGFRFAVTDGVPLYQGDIADADLLAQIFAEQDIGAVMHFAGSIIVPESVENPLKYYENNTAKSRSLIAAAVAAGVPHFIFSSTAATYGIPETSPVTEDSPKRPINPYGMSKLMTEIMLGDTARAHAINFCALRYFNVAGADPQARTGQSTAGATHLIKVAVEAALGKREDVAVFGTDFATPDGTGVRDYIHVSDLAAAHVLALEALIADPQARTGQSTAGATHLIKVAVEAALGKRDSVAVFGTDYATPDGTGVRDYIHVSDLAAAHVLALEALIADPARSLTMNCGYGRGFSVLEVLDAVDRVTNLTINRRLEGRRAGDPDSLISDNRRIKATLPWVPQHADLDTIVAHALAWERRLTEIRAAQG